MKRMRTQIGLTLVELLVVLAILMVLATVYSFGMSRLKVQSRVRSVERMLRLVDEALAEYEVARSSYPEASGGSDLSGVYQEMVTVPNAREILSRMDKHWGQQTPVKQTVAENETIDRSAWPPLNDPWGMPFRYEWQQGGGDVFPLIRSAGPDRQYNTDDDILNR